MATASKSTLSRDVIIEAGLDLVGQTGIDGLSFRKLADKLGVTPMALYRHFDDKQALLTALLDAFILQADVLPKAILSWDEWLVYVSEGMYQALADEPSWLNVLGQIPLGPGGFEVFDTCLRILREAGFENEQAVNAFVGMLQCVFGAALTHSQIKHTVALADLDLDAYPSVTSALPSVFHLEQDSHLYFALLPMIDGLRRRLALTQSENAA